MSNANHTDSIHPDASELESRETSPRNSGFARILPHAIWLTVCLVSIGMMYWWFEFRPGNVALQQMQGTWQKVDGVIPEEKMAEVYFHVQGNETWLAYQGPSGGDKWELQRSRIKSVRPARNFFVVRRGYRFDWGRNEVETEYIVCLNNDGLFQVQGLAPMAPTREYVVRKQRRTETLPDKAKDAIQEYLDRYEDSKSKPADEQ